MSEKFEFDTKELEALQKKSEKFWEIINKTNFKSLDEKQKAYKDLNINPTEKAVIYKENTTTLNYCLPTTKKIQHPPLVIIPSFINKNYILDLMPGHSLIEHLTSLGIPVYIIDWGTPGVEHGELTFDEIIDGTLNRIVKRVLRHSKSEKLHIMGQCIGGILSTVYAAKHNKDNKIISMVNLTTPIDFKNGGKLKEWTNPKHFNLDKIVNSFKEDGVIPSEILHAGFPFLDLNMTFTKYKNLFNFSDNEDFVHLYRALDFWGNDNIPFACEVFRKFIRDLYQENRLIKGEFMIGDEKIQLDNINIPIYDIQAEFDHVFPKEAAKGLFKSNKKYTQKIFGGGHVTILAGLPVRFEVFNSISDFLIKNK